MFGLSCNPSLYAVSVRVLFLSRLYHRSYAVNNSENMLSSSSICEPLRMTGPNKNTQVSFGLRGRSNNWSENKEEKS